MNKSDLTAIITVEECGEVIQGITKVFRFGLNQTHPETGVSNRDHLAEEIGQLQFMLHELQRVWDLPYSKAMTGYSEKSFSLSKWVQYFPNENSN